VRRVVPLSPKQHSTWLTLRGGGERGVPVAAGGTIDADCVGAAYAAGVTPLPMGSDRHRGLAHERWSADVESGAIPVFEGPYGPTELVWVAPDPRAVIEPDEVRLTGSKRYQQVLRATLRKTGWTATLNRRFSDVVAHSARLSRHETTWIVPDLEHAFNELFERDAALSAEVWEGPELVGGLFGIRSGGAVWVSSGFHRRDNAFKVSLVDVCARLRDAGGEFVDLRGLMPHTRYLGGKEIAASLFFESFDRVQGHDLKLDDAELPVARLLPAPARDAAG
jgi:leucyl/phenylalanyl-tRNA--protein transferase